MPPYLAGRADERKEFEKLLEQDTILQNLILTGLRGVGKTVLLETFKPLAIQADWLWVGTDLSESTSVSEESMAIRLLTDLAVVTSSIVITTETRPGIGIGSKDETSQRTLTFDTLLGLYQDTPGLAADKLKAVLETVWNYLRGQGKRGAIFAYDEAQNLADHATQNQYPLSLLLDVFQSIQRKGIPFMLALTGLPTLFPKLVEARTYSERMFRVIFLNQLDKPASKEAILKPIEDARCPVKFTPESVETIFAVTAGYPYFIQYVCREVYDVWVQNDGPIPVPVEEIMRKLDTDFFAGRWARATDRQRDLLGVIAQLPTRAGEFAVQEIVELSERLLETPSSASHVNQMLVSLSNAGLVYKNRWGRYSLAVPLLDEFIRRQLQGN
ncbi:MAG: ATP-binding protein [Armatimonadota bacterium]